jgi:nitroreductase
MSNKTTELIHALQWRYATKAFDSARKIPEDLWHILEKSLVLTPTSYGLQPYKFLVVQTPATRQALLPQSWNQRQVVDCSHFVVFLARTEMTEADVDKFMKRTIEVRKLPPDALTAFRNVIVSDVVKGARGRIAHEWATRQAYIALGNLMTCAAIVEVDACPMEGIVHAEYDKVLKLEGTGYKTAVACALGYRAATDKYATAPKVRYELGQLVQHV